MAFVVIAAAALAIVFPAYVAGAGKGTVSVDAVSVIIAVVSVVDAFVNVAAASSRGKSVATVSFSATTGVGTGGVGTAG